MEEELQILIEAFKTSYLANHFSICDDGLYLRYDTDDSTAKENWTQFCDIQDELKTKGYTLIDPYIEHDCITGTVVKL